MPLPPSRRAVLTPPASPTFKYRGISGASFDRDVKYVRAHLDMGRPVDGPFVAWVLDTLEDHRAQEAGDVDRAYRLNEAVADFLAGKIKKAALEEAHDDYTNGD